MYNLAGNYFVYASNILVVINIVEEVVALFIRQVLYFFFNNILAYNFIPNVICMHNPKTVFRIRIITSSTIRNIMFIAEFELTNTTAVFIQT